MPQNKLKLSFNRTLEEFGHAGGVWSSLNMDALLIAPLPHIDEVEHVEEEGKNFLAV